MDIPEVALEPSTTFQSYAPFWKVDQGFSTKLILRNRHKTEAASATPILYTAGGREIRLSPVELPPNSAQAIPLDDALRVQGEWANSGAIELEFTAPNAAAVTGYTLVSEDQRGFLFPSIFRAGYPGGSHRTLHTPWWFPTEETKARLVLFNASDEPATVRPAVSVGLTRQDLGEILLAPHEVSELDFRTILHDAELFGATRGLLTLTYEGEGNSLVPALWFSDEKTGYSLTAQFSAPEEPRQGEEPAVYYPGILVNEPNPLLGFKQKVSFTPHALLGNTTEGFLTVEMEASYQVPGAEEVERVSLPVSPLAPLETRLVDFSGFLANGLIPAEARQVSLRLSHPGARGDLAARVFALDSTGEYSFGMEGVRGAFPRYDAISWYTAGNRQSLIHVQNISEEEVEARITLSYDMGAGAYKLPLLAVPPGATRTVNLREMIATAQPDEDGNLIPPYTKFGTATVEAADERLAPRLVVSAAQYDPVLGVGAGTFFPCTGVESTELLADPTSGPVGGFDFMTVLAHWSDGEETTVTADSIFESGSTAIATVENGGADHGKLSFVSTGQTLAFADSDAPAFDFEVPTICDFIIFVAVAAVASQAGGGITDVFVSTSPGSVIPGGQTTVTVTVVPNQAGISVNLTVEEVQNSGGHQHLGRPLGSFSASMGTTNSRGEFTTTYTTSLFGGEEKIKATAGGVTGDGTVIVSITEPLSFLGTGSNYVPVGSTSEHPGNHYGTAAANSKLRTIANQYAAQYPGSVLWYNDQSLHDGGLFDIGPRSSCVGCQFWNTPHIEHRLGKNCDVSKGNVPSGRWNALENLFRANGSNGFLDEGDHWHLRF